MSVPTPPVHNKLEACISRLLHQLHRSRDYLELVTPTFSEKEDDPNRQFCFQTVILMLHTFLEEHYRWLVSLATFWQTEDVRAYLISRYDQETATFEAMPAAQLCRAAAKREVSFRDQARRLKGIFSVLFSTGPFADAWCETKCLDLIAVRNIITHQGGMVDETNVPTVKSPGVIVTRAAIGTTVFHELRISVPFMTETLVALGKSAAAIHESLNQDPRYRI